ncbi:hypothetical protein LINPERHAP1_LOCUS20169 [Linum perenne]
MQPCAWRRRQVRAASSSGRRLVDVRHNAVQKGNSDFVCDYRKRKIGIVGEKKMTVNCVLKIRDSESKRFTESRRIQRKFKGLKLAAAWSLDNGDLEGDQLVP